jgi:hypothetical protein
MVKMDTLTGPEPNLEKPLDNRPFRSVRTGNGCNRSQTVMKYGYGTRLVREGYLKEYSSHSHHLRKRHC